MRRTVALAAALAVVATDDRGPARGTGRGPAWVPQVGGAPVRESLVGAVPHLHQPGAPARLILDTTPPAGDVRLLWLEGRATQPVAGGVAVVDEGGQLTIVDGRLGLRRPPARVGGRLLATAAAGPAGGLWLTDAAGGLLLVDSSGRIREERRGPFAHPAVAADSTGIHVWASRSTRRFAFVWDSMPAPVAVEIAGSRAAHRLGTALVPEHVLLTDLANSGHLAVGADAIYYAPFIRDEIVALRATGETLWVAHRDLPHGTREPRFELVQGEAVIDYHPVNLGLALGPDGLLYVLSTPARTTAASRLDVLDPRSGRLLRTAQLATARPTLAADAEGRVYAIDPDRLLRGVPPADRDAFPTLDLPALDGGRIAFAALRGRVVLVNVWASWCAPCRVEMPALDSLRRRLADSGLVFVALNEDHDVADAQAFLRRGSFDFLVGLGGGALQRRIHYPGLPYTVLLDRDGRVVQRWIGFAGRDQLDQIERLARRELDRPTPSDQAKPHHAGRADPSRRP